jgi:NADH-quinone oxidoreductase subunit C
MAERCVGLGVMVMHSETSLLVTYLSRSLPGCLNIVISDNTVIVEVDPAEIRVVISFLKKNQQLRFDCLLDIWGVDYLGDFNRFEINYLLLSVVNQSRIIVRSRVDEYTGLHSVSSIFKSSGWLEREVWDMYGVIFFDNNDLRRILTDYGFEGHPLRKDFPLSGFSEVRYDDGDKRIVYEPLEVSQEYRSFSFKNPWTY